MQVSRAAVNPWSFQSEQAMESDDTRAHKKNFGYTMLWTIMDPLGITSPDYDPLIFLKWAANQIYDMA